jgi:prolyl-tRNA editing enzyme YbaK/EbsC (Cys-tRNA(Pro) deacylase)
MTAVTQPGEARRLRGFGAVRRYLDEEGVDYEIVRHEPTGSARAEARACGAPPDRVVKTVGVWAHRELRVVALPASECLDMSLVRHLLGDPEARLATEAELAREFPQLDAGALPPFGAPAPPLLLVDRRVLSCNWVIANGGDHRHSLRISPLEIVRLSHARVVDIGDY